MGNAYLTGSSLLFLTTAKVRQSQWLEIVAKAGRLRDRLVVKFKAKIKNTFVVVTLKCAFIRQVHVDLIWFSDRISFVPSGAFHTASNVHQNRSQ